MNNSGYSSREILSMQKDAIERVREMQRRANHHLTNTEQNRSNTNNNRETTSSNLGQQKSNEEHRSSNHHEQQHPIIPVAQAPKSQNSIGNLLSSFNLSEDRALILLIVFILVQEGADTPLILALLYLIL